MTINYSTQLKKIKKLWRRIKKRLSLKKNKRRTAYLILTVVIIILSVGLLGSNTDNKKLYDNLRSKQTKLHSLESTLDGLKKEKTQTDQQIKERDQKLQETQKQIDDLNTQLQAKKSSITKVASAFIPAQAIASSGCGDNEYANFIYMHESGCNLNARNAGGCLGIGQACPGSKLTAVCPDLSYECQNSFFTAYANAAYGGWAGAYSAWISKGWW